MLDILFTSKKFKFEFGMLSQNFFTSEILSSSLHCHIYPFSEIKNTKISFCEF